MKKTWLLIYSIFFILNSVFSQVGTWTWMAGENVVDTSGSFGIQGVPSATNTPPGFYEAVGFTDKQGNLWLFTGFRISGGKFADLWKYDVSTNMWTWMKGPGTADQPAVTGVQGVPSPTNNPGFDSWCGMTWVDNNGDFWLFGGSQGGFLNNNLLWRYNISSNEWTWMKGNTANQNGVYGTQGVPDTANYPAGRYESNASWVDNNGDLWLFGGNRTNFLNDLWRYNIATNTWTWMKGGNAGGGISVYGTIGVPNAANTPGPRQVYAKYKDLNGDLWLFGGEADIGIANDWWRYNVASNQWTWMAGSNTGNSPGQYGTKCVAAVGNTPQAKFENKACWTDANGGFWVYGGFDATSLDPLSDFFHFDPVTLKGAWVEGPTTTNQPATYGIKGVSAPSNYPGARLGSVSWLDQNNNLWMFGGWLPGVLSYNDLWRYVIDPSCPQSTLAPPVANFQSNKSAICANDCISLIDLSTNATAWQWTFPGGIPSASTDQNPQVCYLTSGIYNITLVAFNSGGSDTLSMNNYITVNAAPPTPTITQVHNDTIFCSIDTSYKSYQWYFDSAIVANATDTFLVISNNGNYNVEVTGANGCKIAVGINVILGLQNYMKDNSISLSPNPVRDRFTVYGLRFTVARIDIYNVLGEVVQHSPLFWRGVGGEADVSSLPSGIYFVQLIGEKERWVGRFVKE